MHNEIFQKEPKWAISSHQHLESV